ncbi:MAG: NUDIX hydrolase [Paludibacteraceae bacterium]|nr:NUDIX hydrolase [Paludibacteraceae bacterium]
MKKDFVKTSRGWYSYEYPRAALTADNVIFGFDGQDLHILLVRRGVEPYKGKWALPGGFLRMNETIEECASRELKEETTLSNVYMKPVGVYSDLDRDPRGRIITSAFYALVRLTEVKGGDDADEALWVPLTQVPALAFDHDRILRDARQRLKEDIHFRPVGFQLLPEKFTMPQLQRLYEAILDVHFDRRNFMKKMLSVDILENTGEFEEVHGHRAAAYYSFNMERYRHLKSKSDFHLEF